MTAPAPKIKATLGTVGGVPLVVDLHGNEIGGAGGQDQWALKKVTLTQNYTAVTPPGFPDRPPPGVAAGQAWKAGVITAGTTRYFHAHEAAALVAAGAATYA